MKSQLLLAAFAALLVPLAVSQDANDPQDDAPRKGKLSRVDVQEDPDSPDAPQRGIQLDRGQVITLLTSADLDRRENNFDLLVRAARVDREVLQLLTDLSASRSDVELAWTARLALREAKRGASIFGMPFSPFAGQQGLQDLFLPGMGLTDPGALPLFGGVLPQSLFGPGTSRQGQGIELRQDQDGTVLRIREHDEAGEETTREYRGESLEAILEANPELEDLNLRAQSLDGGFFVQLDPRRADRTFETMLEQLRSGQPNLFREFRRGPDGDLKEFLQPFHSSRPVDTRILGVRAREISTARAEALGLETGVGLHVDWVEPGSMAHLLGVGAGAVLLELNDLPLRTVEDITSILKARAPTDIVHLLWIDGAGQKQTNVWRPGK